MTSPLFSKNRYLSISLAARSERSADRISVWAGANKTGLLAKKAVCLAQASRCVLSNVLGVNNLSRLYRSEQERSQIDISNLTDREHEDRVDPVSLSLGGKVIV